MNDQFDVVVVGAGIAGLVAGVKAVEAGARVAVIDAQSIGGRARTTSRDGYDYNHGPHALYLAAHLQPFLQARGISPRGGIAGTGPVGLLRDGHIHELSFKASHIARTSLLRPRSRVRTLRLLATLPRLDVERFVGVSWQQWLSGLPDDVAGLMTMLGRTATYVNAPATFDAGAALRQIQLALHGVRYVDGGWQTIVDSLAAAFTKAGGTIFAKRATTSIAVDGGAGGAIAVETDAGRLTAAALIVAGVGPDAAERITGARVRGREALGGAVHAAALDLAIGRVLDRPVFGIDEPLYLSPHAPTAKLAPVGCGLVSLLRYVPDGESADHDDDDDRVAAGRDHARLRRLAEQVGIAGDDIVHERYLHRLLVANAFPTARGGGLRGRPTVDALGLPGVFLAGDWVGSEYQLADASSASGEAAAVRAVDHARQRIDVRR